MMKCTKQGFCPAEWDYVPYYNPCIYCSYWREVEDENSDSCCSDPDNTCDNQ